MMHKAIENYWNTRAESYSAINREELKSREFGQWRRLLKDLIRKHFPDAPPESLRALDIGTGPGFMGITLASLGLQVTGADSSGAMLEKARSNAADSSVDIHYVLTDAQKPAFPDASFDVLVCRNLTWDLIDPENAYREWHRILKPGGLLLIFDANWYGYLFDAEKRRQYEEDRRNVKKKNFHDYNLHETADGVDFSIMENIARELPLSNRKRPEWDKEVLHSVGFPRVHTDTEVWKRVWNEAEKINYSSTPLFLIRGEKAVSSFS